MKYEYLEYWNERGKTNAEEWKFIKQEKIFNLLSNLDFKTVLELGCGNGEFSKIIKGFDCELIGIDLSSDRIEKNKFIDIGFKQDFINWSFQHRYDLVCCSHFLLHIKPNHIKQVIENIKAISKRYILFIEPHSLRDIGVLDYSNFKYDYDQLMNKKSTFVYIDKSTGAFLYE